MKTTGKYALIVAGTFVSSATILGVCHYNTCRPDSELMEGASTNNVPLMQRAIRQGADVNRVEDVDEGLLPLNAAVQGKNPRAVIFLLDHGAQIDADDGWGTPLVSAVQGDDFDMVKLLLKRGAKMNDEEGNSSALWCAATSGDALMTTFLLDHGANPNTTATTSKPHDRLIDVAKELGHPNTAAILADYARRSNTISHP
jgi:ankyrin repeat protein